MNSPLAFIVSICQMHVDVVSIHGGLDYCISSTCFWVIAFQNFLLVFVTTKCRENNYYNSSRFSLICLMVFSHLTDQTCMWMLCLKSVFGPEQEVITFMLANLSISWSCVHISSWFAWVLPVSSSELELALQETPFSNWNHEKKWWLSVVFLLKTR